ncbi:hypothetical protein [Luethyella okanaganae]|uniref:TadE family protein n=1 Tax=Luethyella okanaganae TaxID=69372 RepID=A0ABW1VF15_9MICO
MPQWRRLDDETGSASLEFVTAGLILLVPLVYLVLAMASIQGGALAVEGAARQAARVYVQASDDGEAEARASRAVQIALADYAIDASAAQIAVECSSSNGCLVRDGSVTMTVRIDIALPLVPDVLSLRDAASVPLTASATQHVSRFWGAEP